MALLYAAVERDTGEALPLPSGSEGLLGVVWLAAPAAAGCALAFTAAVSERLDVSVVCAAPAAAWEGPCVAAWCRALARSVLCLRLLPTDAELRAGVPCAGSFVPAGDRLIVLEVVGALKILPSSGVAGSLLTEMLVRAGVFATLVLVGVRPCVSRSCSNLRKKIEGVVLAWSWVPRTSAGWPSRQGVV